MRMGQIPAGTRALCCLAVRRSWLMITVSMLGIVLFAVGSAAATVALYPDFAAAQRGLGSTLLSSPAVVVMYGKVASGSLAGLAVMKTTLTGALALGGLCAVIVRRHTRIEEEAGRLELLAAAPLDRRAPLLAALITAFGTAAVTSAIVGVGFIVTGFDVTGSLTFALAWCGFGCVAAVVMGVFVQLAADSRSAMGLTAAALGVMFGLRAIGDMSQLHHGNLGWLTWLSPLGWVGEASAFDQNRVWAGGILAGTCMLGAGLAFAMLARRDLGAGLWHAKPGPRESKTLTSPWRLAWRLYRGSFVGWTAALVLLGAMIGSLTGSITDMAKDASTREMLSQMGGGVGALVEVYLATEMRIMAALATAAGTVIVLRIAAQARAGLEEVVLVQPVSRTQWYGVHAALAFALSAVSFSAALITMAMLARAGTSEAPTPGAVFTSAGNCIPAIWLMVAIALLLTGWGRVFTSAVWGVFGASVLVGEFGATLNLPQWLVDCSPFWHMQLLPFGELRGATIVSMLVLVIVSLIGGLALYRSRDLH